METTAIASSKTHYESATMALYVSYRWWHSVHYESATMALYVSYRWWHSVGARLCVSRNADGVDEWFLSRVESPEQIPHVTCVRFHLLHTTSTELPGARTGIHSKSTMRLDVLGSYTCSIFILYIYNLIYQYSWADLIIEHTMGGHFDPWKFGGGISPGEFFLYIHA